MSQEMQKMRDELIDHIDKALVSKADQIPTSWSLIMKDLAKKIDKHIETHERDTQEVFKRLSNLEKTTQWIQDTFAGGKIIGKVSTFIVKFLITVTALSGAWIWLKNTLRS